MGEASTSESEPCLAYRGWGDDWKDAPLSFEQTQLEVVRNEDWNQRGWDWAEAKSPTLRAWVWAQEPSRARLELGFIPTAPEARILRPHRRVLLQFWTNSNKQAALWSIVER